MAFSIRGIWRVCTHAHAGTAVVLALLISSSLAQPALAAPERLSDIIPDAVPDLEGKLNISWNHQQLNLEGPFSDSASSHDYIKLKYTFSPTTAASVRYGKHDLSGDLGIINPLFNDKDSAESFEFDFAINLLNSDAVPADPTSNTLYTAGSAFNLGVSATFFQLDAGPLSQNETLLKAYLAYSTDLTDQLRAHTYFSTGRLSGDEASGSVNRIAAGLDYEVIEGCRPLVLLADGVLDVYNFRQPSFNTSRVSQFNVGLRYKVADGWYGSLGWQTVNDSENDASGSGIFAGLNYVGESYCCEECDGSGIHEEHVEETPDESVPAETLPAPEVVTEPPPPPPPAADAAADPAPQQLATAEPPMMDSGVAKAPASATTDESAAATSEDEVVLDTSGDGQQIAASTPDPLATDASAEQHGGSTAPSDDETAAADPALEAVSAELNDTEVDPAASSVDAGEGVLIPPFPAELPRHTPADAILVRPPAGTDIRITQDETPQQLADDPDLVEPADGATEDADESIEVVNISRLVPEDVFYPLRATARRLLLARSGARQHG